MHYLKRLLLIIKENNLIYFFIFILLLFSFGLIKIDLFENIIFKLIVTFISFIVLISYFYINFKLKNTKLSENLSKMLYWLIIACVLDPLAELWSESFFGYVLGALSIIAFIYLAVLFFKMPWYEFEGCKIKDKKSPAGRVEERNPTNDVAHD